MKVCTTCKVEKPRSEFSRNKNYEDGLWVYCKPCDSARRDTDKYRAQARVRQKQWRLADPRRQARAARKHKYGITPEQTQEMLRGQNHACAICQDEINEATLQVDHCHDTGVVRGLLCRGCNLGLGNFKDSAKLLDAAKEYLG